MPDETLLIPDWPLPPGVHAFVSTRAGGRSRGPWRSFNLGLHVGDDEADVATNRKMLLEELESRCGIAGLSLQWLRQVHGTVVHRSAGSAASATPPEADALYSRDAGIACAVLTADCLPVLFCSDDGREIAVAHAGWRGLVSGVLESTLACFESSASSLSAWLGPAIGPCHFEVGMEVREQFLRSAAAADRDRTAEAFVHAGSAGKYMADLYHLARLRLGAAGLTRVYGDARCTVCDEARWYSYRRDGVTGRFATLILRSPD